MKEPLFQLLLGNAATELKKVPNNLAQTCVTSPPYFSQRKYQTSPVDWEDGWNGELGREQSPEFYVQHLADIFDEVKRVLREDGTFWLNIGDKQIDNDLLGIPWMVAFELKRRGWILRSEIIWHNPSPIPDGAKNRPTKSHEQVFLFSKSNKYFYDMLAIAEPIKYPGKPRAFSKKGNDDRHDTGTIYDPSGRSMKNKRTVWTISNSKSLSSKHFACMPKKLAAFCIEAGSSEMGCCPICKAPMRRILETERIATRPAKNNKQDDTGSSNRDKERHVSFHKTIGWEPTCEHQFEDEVLPCIVLDPFSGAGTTGLEALKKSRSYLGIELNKDYYVESRERFLEIDPMFIGEGELF